MMMAMLGTSEVRRGYSLDALIAVVHLSQLIQIGLFVFLREQPIDNLWRYLIDKALRGHSIALHYKVFKVFAFCSAVTRGRV